jgi:hypothetical protein
MFKFYLMDGAGSAAYADECAEQRPETGRWYIKLGFAGFNTRANNGNGYATKAKAEAVCRKHQAA